MQAQLWNDFKEVNGGADRDRTDDLYNAIVALFQLSYGPENQANKTPFSTSIGKKKVAAIIF